MNPLFVRVALTVPLLLAVVPGGTATAQSNDMFPSRNAALQRARELKCSGAFAMGNEWMPCKDLATYEKAVSATRR